MSPRKAARLAAEAEARAVQAARVRISTAAFADANRKANEAAGLAAPVDPTTDAWGWSR